MSSQLGSNHTKSSGKKRTATRKKSDGEISGGASGPTEQSSDALRETGKNGATGFNPKTERQARGTNNARTSGKSSGRINGQRTNNKPARYPPHKKYNEVLSEYTRQHMDYIHQVGLANQRRPTLIRGKLRALPGNNERLPAFVSCDHGHYTKDVLIADNVARNRAMDGDIVFVQLSGPVGDVDHAVSEEDAGDNIVMAPEDQTIPERQMKQLSVTSRESSNESTWQDDLLQMSLWNPQVSIPKRDRSPRSSKETQPQYQGKVVCIVSPQRFGSELSGDDKQKAASSQRRIFGSLKILQSGTTLLTPLNRSLPQFLCPSNFTKTIKEQINGEDKAHEKDEVERMLYQATYTHGDWAETHQWPPCTNVTKLGESCRVEDEIMALLVENKVDHGDHPTEVLQHVEDAVRSGVYQTPDGDMGWKPTENMYKGRRDYRQQRIFTIDPTTAKDLDDALHISFLPDLNQVEIGVHIADVSFFCRPNTPVDQEAQRRATTVYLVDRTIPMLPRSLCEIACSLNENTERLAFSCVWRMNLDGTLPKSNGKEHVWYGRSVIKSCARLDYATAQNIIEGKVGNLEDSSDVNEKMWPASRRPSGGHTMAEVAADVLLLHKVAMARRKLRFDNGALALNGIKLTFQLDKDGQTPLLAAPYPIRDSNRLVEEYMLLANYLVAQRLITHAKGRALLRQHPEPLEEGLDKVADVAKAAIGFDIDIHTSQALHDSLCRLKQECDDPLVLMSVTQMLMAPMQPANYFVAGSLSPAHWKHFALNIPYYTHFTSPIRRYPDVIVHRLLQATFDESVTKFELSQEGITEICRHCNAKRMASKIAQERCDRVFLSLYVRSHPLSGEMGVVLSVGASAFTVFCPSVRVSGLLYLDEHKDVLSYRTPDDRELAESVGPGPGIILDSKKQTDTSWKSIHIQIFAKIKVTIYCRDKPPIDVKLRLEGPWN